MQKTLEQFESVKQNVILDLDKLVNTISKYDEMTNNVSKMILDKKEESDKTLAEIILEQKNRISEGKFNILVLGEFSCGKSTFLNALIKDKVLPVSVKPTTATINTISYSEDKKVKLQFWGPIDENTGQEIKEGDSKEIGMDDLRSHTTSLTAEADEISKKIKIVEILYPTEYCKNSVTIVDTPGFNSVHSYHDNVTLNYLMNGNAVIWLLNPLQPLSGSEREYLRKAKHYIPKILFVVPKIDLLDNDELDEARDIFKSDIPKETNNKSEVKLYPINAKLAANGDWKTSKFQNFITELEKFLWSDSKTQEMLSPGILNSVNIIDSLKDNINLNLNGLKFSPKEFQKKIEENLPKLERIKKRHNEILQFINDRKVLLLNRVQIEIPNIITRNLSDISSKIINWDGEITEIKQYLPGYLKEKMMDISANVEEFINDEINYIRNETNSRYQDFALDMKEYQASISNSNIQLSGDNFIEEEEGGSDIAMTIGVGGFTYMGALIAGPIGWIVAVGLSYFGGEYLEAKRKQNQLSMIDEKVTSNLRQEINKGIPKFNKNISKTLEQFTNTINSQMTDLINSVNITIESIKKEQNTEKSKIQQRITQFKACDNEFTKIKDSLRLSLDSLN